MGLSTPPKFDDMTIRLELLAYVKRCPEQMANVQRDLRTLKLRGIVATNRLVRGEISRAQYDADREFYQLLILGKHGLMHESEVF